MRKQRGLPRPICEIRVTCQPNGLTAVYLVETKDSHETRELKKTFQALQDQIQVRQLSDGNIVSFAVRTPQSDTCILDEIDDVLKKNYGFVVTQRYFDDLIHRIVRELCADTGSKLLPVASCNSCGKTDPFPATVISLVTDDGSALMSRNYCESCTAEAGATSNKEFVRSLLAADEQDFEQIRRAELVRSRSSEWAIKFRVKNDSTNPLAKAG
jgi:hypothetical protein